MVGRWRDRSERENEGPAARKGGEGAWNRDGLGRPLLPGQASPSPTDLTKSRLLETCLWFAVGVLVFSAFLGFGG